MSASDPLEYERALAIRPPRGKGEIVIMVVVGALLIGAIAAATATLYRLYWGPEAFAERYVQLLSDGRAADALRVPGVAIESEDLQGAKIDGAVSDALLRSAALPGDVTDVVLNGSRMVDGVAEVELEFTVSDRTSTSTFRIVQDGWSGLVPDWRFETSPLAVLDVDVQGSMRFDVNGFELDKRQVSPDGLDANPLTPLQFLVFTPSVYQVSVDTAAAIASPEQVVATTGLQSLPIHMQAEPSEDFMNVVSTKVHEFLESCTEQEVLKPTGCPFGFDLSDRLVDLPTWSISTEPRVRVIPAGANWSIVPAMGIATLSMKVQSIYDGSVSDVEQNVSFTIEGSIDVLPDGTAAIKVTAPEATS